DPGLFRHILKAQPAQVLIKRVVAVQATKIDIRQPVVVEIPNSDTGSVKKNPVGFAGMQVQSVCEVDPCLGGRQQCEACLPSLWHIQIRPSESVFLMPLRRSTDREQSSN